MSRTEHYDDARQLGMAYGRDHACGPYIMIWSTKDYREPDCNNVILDKDGAFDAITMSDVVSIAAENGFNIALPDFDQSFRPYQKEDNVI